MRQEDHCKLTNKELGRPFVDVHKWMDKFYASMQSEHRVVRHHYEGILACAQELKRKRKHRYTSTYKELLHAAALHVAQDMYKEGKQYPIPTRSDYKKVIDGEEVCPGDWPVVPPWDLEPGNLSVAW